MIHNSLTAMQMRVSDLTWAYEEPKNHPSSKLLPPSPSPSPSSFSPSAPYFIEPEIIQVFLPRLPNQGLIPSSYRSMIPNQADQVHIHLHSSRHQIHPHLHTYPYRAKNPSPIRTQSMIRLDHH
jgi:hypothetical protein